MIKTLFISDTVPWPPNNGRYQRVYHLLKAISAVSQVYFVCPTPGGEITGELEALRPFYVQAYPFPSESFAYRSHRNSTWNRRIATVLCGYLHPTKPFLFTSTKSDQAVTTVARLCSTYDFDLVWVERLISLSTLPATLDTRVVVDVDDVEHRRYAHRLRNTAPSRYFPLEILEFLKLRRFERGLRRLSHEYVVCSNLDREILGGTSRVHVIPNGVELPHDIPSSLADSSNLLFVGTMSFAPNVDAVLFFVRRVLPLIHAQVPNVRFLVVGHNPPPVISELHNGTGITVTGSVPTVDPYLRQAAAVVAPLRFGGGTRIKILEAMAYATPVVSTTVGAEGLDVKSGRDLIIANGAEAFAQRCVELLKDGSRRRQLAQAAYRVVREKYTWAHIEHLVHAVVTAGASTTHDKSGEQVKLL